MNASEAPTLGEAEPLLNVKGLTLSFERDGGVLPVLHGVDLTIAPGEIVGLVGESGSGKSLTCLSLLRLLGSNAVLDGQIRYRGSDLVAAGDAQMVRLRGREIAMIVQEPQSALNPVQTIGRQIEEALLLGPNSQETRKSARARAEALLREVGLPDPVSRLKAYPHELSGGQAQRVLIAMMLARKPRLLLADEPTTALDVTVQAQILALIRRLSRDHGMAILLVTHDLALVAQNCDRVAVMYCGRVVECGPVRSVFSNPHHPYSVGLLGARPRVDRKVDRLLAMEGVVPEPLDLPPGCSFAPRCPRAAGPCGSIVPLPRNAADGHVFSCHHPVEPEFAQ